MSDTVVSWLRKGAWSVADHGMSSGASFLVNVLLIWWIAPHAYGAFAVAISVMMLLHSLQAAALTEPMLIMLPKRDVTTGQDYLAGVLALQIACGVAAAALCALAAMAAWAMGHVTVAETLVGLALASPGVLTQELLRRMHYARLSPRRAALGSMAHAGLAVAGVALLNAGGLLRLWTAFAVLAAASALTSLGLAASLPRPWLASRHSARDVGRQHWEHARWLLLSCVFRWAPLNLFYVVLPPLLGGAAGLIASGVLRASMNLIRPLLTALSALASLALPAFSAGLAEEKAPPRGKLLALIAVTSISYWAVLAAFGDYLVVWLYGSELAYPPRLLMLLGLLPLIHGAAVLINAELMARLRTDNVFKSSALATAGAVLLGVPLTYAYGLYGAAAGILIAYGILLLAQLVLLRSAIQRR